MKIVAFLPAKGSSTRIPNKNLSLLDGKPLFLHTLEKLMLCDFIDEVFLDTESDEIINAASEIPCKLLRRDPLLASNTTDGNSLFMNQVKSIDADIYIQILGTSPFINIKTIKKGVEILTSDNSIYDSVVLVRNEKKYLWEDGIPKYNTESIPNSVDIKPTTTETMGLYIVKRNTALETRRRIGKTPFLLEASAIEAVDVNWAEDFELANLIASGLREKDRKLFLNLRNHLTSSMLSDILDDLGSPFQIIRGFTPNISNAKFLGRAKTLKLRKLRTDEDFRGVYDALHSYSTIIPNDIIMVENETPEYAYFGELNANLAIRAGASAVVVGGKTRDSS